nr:MAG TPA: apocytochrome F [Caudoviricetes sp.]
MVEVVLSGLVIGVTALRVGAPGMSIGTAGHDCDKYDKKHAKTAHMDTSFQDEYSMSAWTCKELNYIWR